MASSSGRRHWVGTGHVGRDVAQVEVADDKVARSAADADGSSSSGSSTAAMVTFCGMFQLPGVKVIVDSVAVLTVAGVPGDLYVRGRLAGQRDGQCVDDATFDYRRITAGVVTLIPALSLSVIFATSAGTAIPL